MAKADLLRVHEVRDAYRLIGECRDLGSDPELWQTRLLEGLCRLIGVPAVSGGEGTWVGAQRRTKVISNFTVGFDEGGLRMLREWQREVGTKGCPIFRALDELPDLLVTRSRSQLVADRDWYRSPSFLRRTAASIDHVVTSLRRTPKGTATGIALHQPAGARDFSARQVQLVHFLHDELGPLVGRALVSLTEASPAGLSPRLRQTLACLLEGDSEKQVAARLGLSQSTTHQYVTALYRHFGVRSRAQLLAHVLRRLGRGSWDGVLRRFGTTGDEIEN
jgi:DNA-binding CsgD family transcriptional regulator